MLSSRCSVLSPSVLAILLSLVISPAFAWNNSFELGYGYSHDPNHSKYHNSGVLVSGDLLALYRSPAMFWSITGSFGRWFASAPTHKNLATGAISLALRYYPQFIPTYYPAYIFASAGPALMTHRQFGLNKQASIGSIQTNFGVGMEFNYIDVNLRIEHFSNADLGNPNEGFNIQYLLSVGYLF